MDAFIYRFVSTVVHSFDDKKDMTSIYLLVEQSVKKMFAIMISFPQSYLTFMYAIPRLLPCLMCNASINK